MAQNIRRGFGVPRWRHTSVEVPSTGQILAASEKLQNDTWFRWRLIGVSFTNDNVTTRTVQVKTMPQLHPEWSKMLLVDIGKSGCSDQNLVRSPLSALCGHPKHNRQKRGGNNMGRTFNFPTPYILPRGEGLEVSAAINWPGFEDVSCPVPELSFCAKGWDSEGYPAILAGSASFTNDDGVTALGGAMQQIKSPDLFNNGKNAIYIDQFNFRDIDTVVIDWNEEVGNYYGWKGDGTQTAWLVNPVNDNFTQFMPDPLPIPTGNIAPDDRIYDGGSESPLCYWFPPNTYLDPSQQLSVRFSSLSDDLIKVNVCLFGELEVR